MILENLLLCMDFVVRGCELRIDLRNIKFVVNWLIPDNLIEPRSFMWLALFRNEVSLQCTLEKESVTFQFIAIENQVTEALT
jgi:hypothetical protein